MVQCPCCGVQVPPQTMVLSTQARYAQVCQSCAANEQRTNLKEGTSSAYWKGAAAVGVFVLFFVIRILLRMMAR